MTQPEIRDIKLQDKMKRILLLILLSNFALYGQKNINPEIKIDSIKNVSTISRLKGSELLELERYKKFKTRLDTTYTDNYLQTIRTFSKDSLKTLAIKLISIKELQEKKLLRKDIELNTSYYTQLLDELKSSEISVNEYLFLEQELTFYSLKKEKYRLRLSITLNIIFFSIITFLLITFSLKKKGKKIRELSKQEYKIKEFIIDGKSNKEIAEELFISLNTVKTHITNIYHKLNVSNRKELFLKFKK